MFWDDKTGRKTEVSAERCHAEAAERLKRVQELRSAIANGTYRVPAEQIADSLLRLPIEATCKRTAGRLPANS